MNPPTKCPICGRTVHGKRWNKRRKNLTCSPACHRKNRAARQKERRAWYRENRAKTRIMTELLAMDDSLTLAQATRIWEERERIRKQRIRDARKTIQASRPHTSAAK